MSLNLSLISYLISDVCAALFNQMMGFYTIMMQLKAYFILRYILTCLKQGSSITPIKLYNLQNCYSNQEVQLPIFSKQQFIKNSHCVQDKNIFLAEKGFQYNLLLSLQKLNQIKVINFGEQNKKTNDLKQQILFLRYIISVIEYKENSIKNYYWLKYSQKITNKTKYIINLKYKIDRIKQNQVYFNSLNQSYIISELVLFMLNHQRKKISFSLMGAQILAGSITAFAVSPLNVVADKSIMIYSKTSVNLFGIAKNELLNIVKNPIAFLKDFSFRWMFFVYVPTYSANNLFDHYNLAYLFNRNEQDFIEHKYQKLGFVFFVNTLCSLIKDKKYAEKYANKLPKFPLSSYLLFFSRDLVAMAGAFTLPPILAPHLQSIFQTSKQSSVMMAQLLCPLFIQLIGTPLHLSALDINNNPNSTLTERITRIKSIYPSTLALRMLRFLPAYGIGGIVNIKLRKYLKQNIPNDE